MSNESTKHRIKRRKKERQIDRNKFSIVKYHIELLLELSHYSYADYVRIVEEGNKGVNAEMTVDELALFGLHLTFIGIYKRLSKEELIKIFGDAEKGIFRIDAGLMSEFSQIKTKEGAQVKLLKKDEESKYE